MSDSILVAKPSKITLKGELNLECGKTLKHIEMVYETYGSLNDDASNAISEARAAFSVWHVFSPGPC